MKHSHIFAFMGKGDDESIVAWGDSPTNLTPLVCTTPRMLKLMRQMAQEISSQTGKPIQVIKFTNPVLMEEISPQIP